MAATDFLTDPRLLGMSSVNRSVARERLIEAYLSEDPDRKAKYDALDDEKKSQVRDNLQQQFSSVNPQAFSVELEPAVAPTRKVTYAGPEEVVYETKGKPAVTRPLYDPRTETLIDGIRTGKVDPAAFDDKSVEELAPFLKASMTKEDYDNFISPYRERLMKEGIKPGSFAAKSAIRGAAPKVVENLAEKAGEGIANVTGTLDDYAKDKERYRKWQVAYGDIDEGFRSTGGVAALMAASNTLARGLGTIASRTPRLASQLAGIGALDYAYAQQLPGFSAELFEDPGNKALATVAEGAALGALSTAGTKLLKQTRLPYVKPPEIDVEHFRNMPNPYAKADVPGKAAEVFDEFLTPISTRLDNINPSLKYAERKFEEGIHQRDYQYKKQVDPWLNQKKRMSKADNRALDIAEKNGDVDEIKKLVGKYHLGEAYAAKRAALDSLEKDALEVGYEFGHIDNFSPRKVKDVKGFMTALRGDKGRWGPISKAIDDEAKKRGLPLLTEADQAEVANNVIRGYGDRLTNSAPGALKARKFDKIPEEYLKFYKHSDDALLDYIDTVVNATEKRRFLGKHMPGSSWSDAAGSLGEVRTMEGIGNYVTDLVRRGEIKPWQESEVINILQARLVQKPGFDAIKAYKSLAYIDTMGSPISAVTQIGDLAFSAYKNGYFNTIRHAFTPKRVKMEDVGIHKVAAEFGDRGKLNKAVDKVFTLTGLNAIDRLGKETLLNSSLEEFQRKVRPTAPKGTQAYSNWKKRYDAFGKDLVDMFGVEAPKVVEDLARGRVTENVKFLLLNRLLDFQPVALSEVPAGYLKNPNGRLLYMLKTFTIKQIDVFRREAFREIARGNVAQGLGNLTRLGGAFMLFNAGADEIKDLMLGRETSLSDMAIDNALRAVGVNKFAIYDARRNKDLVKSAMMMALPPTKLLRAAYTDVEKMYEGKFDLQKAESWQSVPVVGKFYYWWFGGGAEKRKKD